MSRENDDLMQETVTEKTIRPGFQRSESQDFYHVARQRVQRYFEETKQSTYGNAKRTRKAIFLFSLFVLSYVSFYLPINPWVLRLIAGCNGFLTALLGFNIAHDAVHGSFSPKSWVNKMLGLVFNIVGANDFMWRIKHNIIHHTYTNVPGHDDDIMQIKILRMEPHKELMKIHRFQYIYAFLLYPLATLSWVFIRDYVNFFRQDFQSAAGRKHPVREFIRLLGYKILYYALFIVLPIMYISLPWYAIAAGFVFMHMVEGLVLSIVFQLAHVVEQAQFPIPGDENELTRSWAVHQMYTTADFATGSKLVTFLVGGLNFQVEHHLFPKVCHIHYPQ
ncbi:MAG: acyl-CoA desaturase, partial [Flavobacteriales bacterium]|nr:acyl-CoA desaturase [Flavobacteriales bacterium]